MAYINSANKIHRELCLSRAIAALDHKKMDWLKIPGVRAVQIKCNSNDTIPYSICVYMDRDKVSMNYVLEHLPLKYNDIPINVVVIDSWLIKLNIWINSVLDKWCGL